MSKKARSLAAEWALINDEAAAGRLTPTYVESMHKSLRQNLQSTYSSLTRRNSEYGEKIKALIAEPADAAPAELRSRSKNTQADRGRP